LLPGGVFSIKFPLHERYAKRARCHIELDVQQALADFTKALELIPKTLPKTERMPFLQERAAIYAQLEMNQELSVDLEEVLCHLTTKLETASGNEKQNMAIKLASIYMSLESVYRKLGVEKEVIRTHLGWTYFAEENRHEIFTGKGISETEATLVSLFGFDAGLTEKYMAHDQVEQMAKDFQNERMRMLHAGQVKAIGHCSKCRQVLVLDTEFQCSLCLNRITPEGRYVMPEEVNAAVQAMRWRLHLPMGGAQHKVVERPTFSTATGIGIREIVARYGPMITDDHFFVQPNIPQKKLTNALRAYAMDVMAEDVLVLYDIFGDAKEGAILTETHLYAQGSLQRPVSIKLSSIEEVAFTKGVSDTATKLLVNGLPFLRLILPEKQATHITHTFAPLLKEIVATFQPQANTSAPMGTPQLKAVGQSTVPQDTSRRSIREIVARYDPMITDNHFYFQPNIPSKKLTNALEAYARDIMPEDVLVLFDNTAFGSAKNGAILTETRLYAHDDGYDPVIITLFSIEEVSTNEGVGWNDPLPVLLVNGLPFLDLAKPEKQSKHQFVRMLREIVTTFQPLANAAAPVEVPPSRSLV
jgi:hypothetical protein